MDKTDWRCTGCTRRRYQTVNLCDHSYLFFHSQALKWNVAAYLVSSNIQGNRLHCLNKKQKAISLMTSPTSISYWVSLWYSSGFNYSPLKTVLMLVWSKTACFNNFTRKCLTSDVVGLQLQSYWRLITRFSVEDMNR